MPSRTCPGLPSHPHDGASKHGHKAPGAARLPVSSSRGRATPGGHTSTLGPPCCHVPKGSGRRQRFTQPEGFVSTRLQRSASLVRAEPMGCGCPRPPGMPGAGQSPGPSQHGIAEVGALHALPGLARHRVSNTGRESRRAAGRKHPCPCSRADGDGVPTAWEKPGDAKAIHKRPLTSVPAQTCPMPTLCPAAPREVGAAALPPPLPIPEGRSPQHQGSAAGSGAPRRAFHSQIQVEPRKIKHPPPTVSLGASPPG